MQLHGSLVENLQASLASARRHRGHPVYSDTLTYWRDLIAYARAMKRSQPTDEMPQIEKFVSELEQELAMRF
jgi:hypothetical protein